MRTWTLGEVCWDAWHGDDAPRVRTRYAAIDPAARARWERAALAVARASEAWPHDATGRPLPAPPGLGDDDDQ